MVNFWKMAIAFFAMMSMVVVPVSCGDDDDDDKDDKGSSSDGFAGKYFADGYYEEESENYHWASEHFIKFYEGGRIEEYSLHCEPIDGSHLDVYELQDFELKDEGTYRIEGSTLILKWDGYDPERYNIIKFGNTYAFEDEYRRYEEKTEAEKNAIVADFKKKHTH